MPKIHMKFFTCTSFFKCIHENIYISKHSYFYFFKRWASVFSVTAKQQLTGRCTSSPNTLPRVVFHVWLSHYQNPSISVIISQRKERENIYFRFPFLSLTGTELFFLFCFTKIFFSSTTLLADRICLVVSVQEIPSLI